MRKVELHDALCKIDNGRFTKIVSSFELRDVCSKCGYFNLSITDLGQRYRCNILPGCIAGTLSAPVISFFNWKLGWIDSEQHMDKEPSVETLKSLE